MRPKSGSNTENSDIFTIILLSHVKRHVCGVKNWKLVHGLFTSVKDKRHSGFLNFARAEFSLANMFQS